MCMNITSYSLFATKLSNQTVVSAVLFLVWSVLCPDSRIKYEAANSNFFVRENALFDGDQLNNFESAELDKIDNISQKAHFSALNKF